MMAPLYAGQRVVLLTQHGKERVLATVLEPALGCRVERVTGYDTDRLGTITRDTASAVLDSSGCGTLISCAEGRS